jgi:hypothetical protein
MRTPTKIVINCDLEQARASREWKTHAQLRRERRHAKAIQVAIEAGVPVQALPYMGKPREVSKAQGRKQRKKSEIRELKEQIAKLKSGFKEKPSYQRGMGSEFYQTREWRELRWKVLIAGNGKCNECNRGKADGIILHVDHIKPRSKFPELELVFTNLQVLCEDCNIGKSNR